MKDIFRDATGRYPEKEEEEYVSESEAQLPMWHSNDVVSQMITRPKEIHASIFVNVLPGFLLVNLDL